MNPSFFSLYMIQGLAILVSLFDISWYFIGRENFKIIILRNVIIKILTISCIFLFVHQSDDLLLYIFILTFGNLIGSLSLWPYLKKEVYLPRFNNLNLKKHFINSITIFIPSLAAQIMLIANKNMIGSLNSISNAGIYSQADTIIRMVLSIVSSIWVVLLPRTANMHAKGDSTGINRMLIKTCDISLGITIGIAFGISAISVKFAPLFFGSSFKQVGYIMIALSPIIVSYTLSQILGDQYLLPLNKMTSFIRSAILGMIINIVVNFALIPKIGIWGALISINLAYFSMVIYRYTYIKSEFKIKEAFKNLWKYCISGLVMFLIINFFNYYDFNDLLRIIIQILSGVVIYLVINACLKTKLWYLLKNVLKIK